MPVQQAVSRIQPQKNELLLHTCHTSVSGPRLSAGLRASVKYPPFGQEFRGLRETRPLRFSSQKKRCLRRFRSLQNNAKFGEQDLQKKTEFFPYEMDRPLYNLRLLFQGGCSFE